MVNLHKVAAAAAVECERQHVGLARLVTLLEGYEFIVALDTALTRTVILNLGYMVEPDNGQGAAKFRSSPVTFASGGTAANHSEIERLIHNLIEYGENYSADEWVKQFLWIHPFNDGNGRTAWVLYNFLNGTLDSPLPLPDFF